MHSELELGEDGSTAQVAHDPEAVCEGDIAPQLLQQPRHHQRAVLLDLLNDTLSWGEIMRI